MEIDKEQFDKAQKFVIDTLEESQDKHGKTKQALQNAVKLLEEEFRNADNIDYQRSLMALAGEMSDSIKEFTKGQSQ